MTSTDSSSTTNWNWMFMASSTTYLESEIQQTWTWQPPSSGLPRIHAAPMLPVVVAPHIPKQGQKMFRGHLFGIGGSKK